MCLYAGLEVGSGLSMCNEWFLTDAVKIPDSKKAGNIYFFYTIKTG